MFEVRYLDRMNMEEDAFLSLVEKYSRNLKLKHKILIVFDLRLKDFGSYWWGAGSRTHIIRISPTRCKHRREENYEDGWIELVRVGPASEKFQVISTTIHELYHAHQKEEKGSSFNNVSFDGVKEITNPELSSWYSECEIEARIYENKNIKAAVEYYDDCCKE